MRETLGLIGTLHSRRQILLLVIHIRKTISTIHGCGFDNADSLQLVRQSREASNEWKTNQENQKGPPNLFEPSQSAFPMCSSPTIWQRFFNTYLAAMQNAHQSRDSTFARPLSILRDHVGPHIIITGHAYVPNATASAPRTSLRRAPIVC